MADQRLEVVSKIPLFANLSGRHLRKLLRSATEDHYEEGATIVRQRGRTDTMFVVLEGEATIIRDGRTIGKRSQGDYFGEISVIDGRPRTGTVIADTPLRCLVFYRSQLKEVVTQEPGSAWSMLEALASRIRELNPTTI